MQVAAITGKEECSLVERAEPHPFGNMAVVKVLTAPMCTEHKQYTSGHLTVCLGHEAVGVVSAVAQEGRVRVGQRVVVMPQYACGACSLCLAGDFIHCRNSIDALSATGNSSGTATYAQYILKPDWLLLPIPDDMTTDHASLACCGLGPTFGAMQRMEVTEFDTVLIAGMGPVGLGGVINGAFRGAKVIAIEGHPYRAALAKRLGASAVIDPQSDQALAEILRLTDGLGATASLDCSGSAGAQRLLLDATRRRGRVAFIGEAGELTIHVSNDMIRKGLTLFGQWHYNLTEAGRIMEVIRRSRSLLDLFITHTFPMSEVKQAFELQRTGNCGKVLLHPWE